MIEGFHAVSPKTDCPHCTPENIWPISEIAERVHCDDPCYVCGNKGENWLCLKPGCAKVACSRYVKSHMVNDHQKEHPNHDHPIVFSFADFSYWCYICDSYIIHPLLTHQEYFTMQKFGDDMDLKEMLKAIRAIKNKENVIEEGNEDDLSDDDKQKESKEPSMADQVGHIEKQLEDLKIEENNQEKIEESKEEKIEDDKFTYEKLVKGLQEGQFKNILILTGAGISVSAGIPDFRSPGTGLYDNLQEFNLPTPEMMFHLDYFKDKPEAFYRFAQNFDLTKFDATPTHYFAKMIQDKNLLWRYMTQNIDNLEEKTGMDMSAVVQCHGSNRGATCSVCKRPADKVKLQDIIREGKEIYYCEHCKKEGWDSPVKPDITFFGEALPQEFQAVVIDLNFSPPDLCLIMGTAMAVSPFNMIPGILKKNVPKVLFNMENIKSTSQYDFMDGSKDKVFVQGKCDEMIAKLVKDCGWQDEFKECLPEIHKDKI